MWESKHKVLELIKQKLLERKDKNIKCEIDKVNNHMHMYLESGSTIKIQIGNSKELGDYEVSITRKYTLREAGDNGWDYGKSKKILDGERQMDLLIENIQAIILLSVDNKIEQDKDSEIKKLRDEVSILTRERDNLRGLMHRLRCLLEDSFINGLRG